MHGHRVNLPCFLQPRTVPVTLQSVVCGPIRSLLLCCTARITDVSSASPPTHLSTPLLMPVEHYVFCSGLLCALHACGLILSTPSRRVARLLPACRGMRRRRPRGRVTTGMPQRPGLSGMRRPAAGPWPRSSCAAGGGGRTTPRAPPRPTRAPAWRMHRTRGRPGAPAGCVQAGSCPRQHAPYGGYRSWVKTLGCRNAGRQQQLVKQGGQRFSSMAQA